jgi:ABC-type cobalt transport system substrate-binding protein
VAERLTKTSRSVWLIVVGVVVIVVVIAVFAYYGGADGGVG